jgi:hypothetical protein
MRLWREKPATRGKDLWLGDELEKVEVASGITGEDAVRVYEGATNGGCVAVKGGDARCH